MPASARILGKEEMHLWSNMLAESTDGTVFHSPEWNALAEETAGTQCLHVVSENKGALRGGMVVHLHRSTVLVSAPFPGYSGPVFHSSVSYAEHTHTYAGYQVHRELLDVIEQTSGRMVIRNDPGIWNARPYTFHKWHVETRYTHLLRNVEYRALSNDFSTSAQDRVKDGKLVTGKAIPSTFRSIYSNHVARNHRHLSVSIPAQQLDWLEKSNLGTLAMLTLQNDQPMALCLLIFCRKKRRMYAGPILTLSKADRQSLIRAFISQLVTMYGRDFDSIDLGESPDMETSRTKDFLGGVLTPFYVARYPAD
jgi:hypothetical protein